MDCQPAAEDSVSGRSLEERVRALEDERDIRDLLVRYAVCLDRRNLSGYARLFAEDGRWFGRMGDVHGR
jgi:hypothetical protein